MSITKKFTNALAALTTMVVLNPSALAETYEVQPGDTLWKIASHFSEGQVTTHEMITALYQQNSNTIGNNINNIKAGMMLKIPDTVAASHADSSVATRLLSGSHVSTYSQAQADALILKIENIEAEINQAIQDASNTKQTFQSGITE